MPDRQRDLRRGIPESAPEEYDETAEVVGRWGIRRRDMRPIDVLMEKVEDVDEALFLLSVSRVQLDEQVAELKKTAAELKPVGEGAAGEHAAIGRRIDSLADVIAALSEQNAALVARVAALEQHP